MNCNPFLRRFVNEIRVQIASKGARLTLGITYRLTTNALFQKMLKKIFNAYAGSIDNLLPK